MNARMRDEFLRGQRNSHGPAWRSLAAQQLTDPGRRSASQSYDPLTHEASKYFAMRARGASPAQCAAKFPRIDAACGLHNDASKTDPMKLLVLVDAATPEIATRVAVDVEIVTAWEELFFDIRPLRGALEWLAVHVIEAERRAGNSGLAARMKLAVTAGAAAIDAVLDMDAGLPLDAADRLFRRKLKLGLKFDEAVELATDNDRNRMRFIQINTQLEIAKQRLEFDGQKLAARCSEAQRAHELAKMRELHRQSRADRKADAATPASSRGRSGSTDSLAAAALSAQQQQDLHEARQEFELAAKARAAESPLAKLTWDNTKPKLKSKSKPKPKPAQRAKAKRESALDPAFRPPAKQPSLVTPRRSAACRLAAGEALPTGGA